MKKKVWDITVKDNPNRVVMGENDEFYTTDTEAYLVFNLQDKDFQPQSAMLTLENSSDGSLKSEEVSVVDDNITWEIPERYIEHSGNWQGQLVYEDTKDGQPELYTSAPFTFVVNSHIGDKKKPSLVEIENWEKFIRDGTELIGGWKEYILELKQRVESGEFDGADGTVRFEEFSADQIESLRGETGRSMEFDWDGTQLGVRIEGQTDYHYIELKGEKGDTGEKGEKGEKGDTGEVENLDSSHIVDALGYVPISETDVPDPSWANLQNKPTEFNPTSHTHSINDVTGLRAELDSVPELTKENVGLGNVDNVKQASKAEHDQLATDFTSVSDSLSQIHLNVKDFGAVGDGETDDISSIQEAINHLKDVGGGVLYFPAGHYKISEALKFYREMDGYERITVAGTGMNNGAVIEQTNKDLPVFDIKTTSGNFRGFEIKDLTITNNGGIGLQLRGVQYTRFTNILFSIVTTPVHSSESGFNHFDNCWFYYNRSVVEFHGSENHVWGGTTFSNCKFGEEIRGIDLTKGSFDVEFNNCNFHFINGLETDGDKRTFIDITVNLPSTLKMINCTIKTSHDNDDNINYFIRDEFGTTTLMLSDNFITMGENAEVFYRDGSQHIGYSQFKPKKISNNMISKKGGVSAELYVSEYGIASNELHNSMITNNTIENFLPLTARLEEESNNNVINNNLYIS